MRRTAVLELGRKLAMLVVAFFAIVETGEEIHVFKFRLNRPEEDVTCTPKVAGWSVGYCVLDEANDLRAGFLDMKPPIHPLWCSCFATEDDDRRLPIEHNVERGARE